MSSTIQTANDGGQDDFGTLIDDDFEMVQANIESSSIAPPGSLLLPFNLLPLNAADALTQSLASSSDSGRNENGVHDAPKETGLMNETMCESFASSGGASAEQLASLLRSQADTTEALERHLQALEGFSILAEQVKSVTTRSSMEDRDKMEMREQLQQALGDVAKLNQERAALEDKLRESAKHMGNSRAEVLKLTEDNAKAEEQVERLSAQAIAAFEQVKAMEKRVAELEGYVNTQQGNALNQHQNFQMEMMDLRTKFDNAAAQLAEKDTTIASLSTLLREAQRNLENMTLSDFVQVRPEAAVREETPVSLHRTASNASAGSSTSVMTRASELGEGGSELERLRKRNGVLLQELENMNMKLSEEVARRMQMEEEMQGPGYGMGQEGAPAQPERVPLHLIDRAEHTRAVEERDRQIAALRQQVELHERQLREVRGELDDRMAVARALQEDQNDATRIIADYRHEVDRLKEHCARLGLDEP